MLIPNMTNQQWFDSIDHQLGELAGVAERLLDVEMLVKNYDWEEIFGIVGMTDGLDNLVNALEKKQSSFVVDGASVGGQL